MASGAQFNNRDDDEEHRTARYYRQGPPVPAPRIPRQNIPHVQPEPAPRVHQHIPRVEREAEHILPRYFQSSARDNSRAEIHDQHARVQQLYTTSSPPAAAIARVLLQYSASGSGRDVWRQQYQRNRVLRQAAEATSSSSSRVVPAMRVDTNGRYLRRFTGRMYRRSTWRDAFDSSNYDSEGSSSSDDSSDIGYGYVRVGPRPRPPPRGGSGGVGGAFMSGAGGENVEGIINVGPGPSGSGGRNGNVLHVVESEPVETRSGDGGGHGDEVRVVEPVPVVLRPPPPPSRERDAAVVVEARPHRTSSRGRVQVVPNVPSPERVHIVSPQRSRHRHRHHDRDRDILQRTVEHTGIPRQMEPGTLRGGGLEVMKLPSKRPTWFFMFTHGKPNLIPQPCQIDLRWNNKRFIARLRSEYRRLHRGWIFKPYTWAHDIGMVYVLIWSYNRARNSYKLQNKAELVGSSGNSTFSASDFRYLLDNPPPGRTFGRTVDRLVQDVEDAPEVILMFQFADLPRARVLITLALLTIPMSAAAGAVYGVFQQDVANAISLASYIATAFSLFFAILAAGSLLGIETPHVYTPTDEMLEDIVRRPLRERTRFSRGMRPKSDTLGSRAGSAVRRGKGRSESIG